MKPRAVLRNILEVFSTEKVLYAVLRNDEFVVDTAVPIESLDMVIAQEDIARASFIFEEYGFQRRKPQFSLKHLSYFKLVGTQLVSFDIQRGGVYWNDMCYLGEDILTRRVKKDFYYVLSAEDYYVMLVAHSILGKRYFKPKYQQILASLKVDTAEVEGELGKIFTPYKAKQILNLIQEKRFTVIPIYCLVLWFLFKKNHLFTFLALSWRWMKWKKPLQPWPLISVLGPDGAGKSTLVRNLDLYLQARGRKTAIIYTGRGRGHFLPIGFVGRTYKVREKRKDAVQKVISWRRKAWYTLSFFVFSLDLWLRTWTSIFPQRMRRRIVITDRYCSDIILMKYVPLWLKKSMLYFFPLPTLSFYLHNTPEVLHQRREEESVEELRRQLVIFPLLEKRFKPIHIITEDEQHDAERAIVTVMNYLCREWY